MSDTFFPRASKKAGEAFNRKKASFVADFSQIPGRYPIEFMSVLSASGNVRVYLITKDRIICHPHV